MRRKDEMEIQYWKQADLECHRAKMSIYLWAFGFYGMPESILEIACGPLGGILPLLIRAKRRVGIDPLCDEYRACGLMSDAPGVEYISAHYEEWATDEKFDAVFACDALDHGEMGFFLVPKLASMLNPGGRLYVHVNLRPTSKLNAIHDHKLTIEQLDAALKKTALVELRRDIYPEDVDNSYDCPTLVGVWELPR